MKQTILVYLLLTALSTSCVTMRSYPTQAIEGFPLKNSTPLVGLHLPDDGPKKSYTAIMPLEVEVRKSDGIDYAYTRLREEASKHHLDAVIRIEKYIDQRPTTTLLDALLYVISDDNNPYTEEPTYQSERDVIILRGVGIKYIANLDYITKCVKEELIYNEEQQLKGKYIYKPDGSMIEEEFESKSIKKWAKTLLLPYSSFELLEDPKNWSHASYNGLPKIRKKYNSGNWLEKKCKIRREVDGRIKKINITYGMPSAGEIIKKETVAYEYDESNRLKERVITNVNNNIYIERLLYQADGKVRRKDYFQKSADGSEQLLFYTLLKYYQQTDIPNWINIQYPTEED